MLILTKIGHLMFSLSNISWMANNAAYEKKKKITNVTRKIKKQKYAIKIIFNKLYIRCEQKFPFSFVFVFSDYKGLQGVIKKGFSNIRGAYDRFPHFFHMGI